MMRKWRQINEIDLRSLGKETGISASTLDRIEHGKAVDGETMVKLMIWLLGTPTKSSQRKT